MNCPDFEAIAVELASSRSLDSALRESALAHARSCPACAAALEDQRRLSAGFRTLAVESRSMPAPARLEASLRSAFRAQSALAPPVRGAQRWYGWAVLAAACLVLSLTLAGRFTHPAPVRRAHPVSPAPVRQAAPKTMLAEARPPAPPIIRRPRMQPVAARRVQRRSLGEDSETDFLPLVYGAPLTPFDRGQIVRLELSPTALAVFGVPVNGNRADPIQADVLFAEDGMARAIRFVK